MCFAAYSNGTFRISLEPKVLTKMLNIKKCFQSSYTFWYPDLKQFQFELTKKKLRKFQEAFSFSCWH